MTRAFCKNTVVVLLSFAIGSLMGCRPASQNSNEPDLIKLISEDPQYGIATSNDIKHISLEVLTAPITGILGGKGSRQPIVGERLLIRALNPASGLKPLVSEGVTDAGGRLDFDVSLGPTFGDQYLEVVCSSRTTVKKRLRFVSGVIIAHNKQEVVAGETPANPFRLTLLDSQHKPLVGVPVNFSIGSQPGKGARLVPTMSLTDESGVAEVELYTAPGITGVYKISAEIMDVERGVAARPVFWEASAIHVSGILIGVFGGLAIFVFGMTLMRDGLQQVAGNRMKKFLACITGNRLKAILAGATVAGLIHSSSATTVMTVGFVNAGLLTLKQAIGVIFGANIGTTVTGQMISFDLVNLALPSLTFGVVLMFAIKSPAGRGMARLILGFGLLFFGMEMMSDMLKNVSEFPSFVRFFQLIDCKPSNIGDPIDILMVIRAVGIGILTTMVMQSSAATIGLAIALANSGLLNFWTAVPIVLGDNIGTTITAILASLSASRTAKQTALAHSLFNIFGTIIVVCLFFIEIQGVPVFLYAVDHITQGEAFTGENVGRHIAAAHTLFNVSAVLLFTPFIGALTWLCAKLIPVRKPEIRTVLVSLEKSWLTTPSLALDAAIRATTTMTERAVWVASESIKVYRGKKSVPFEEIKRVENDTDEMQGQIMDYLMQLTRRRLSMAQTLAVPTLMHCVSDAERIADIGVLIAELAPKSDKTPALTEAAQLEIDEIIGKTHMLAQCVINGLQKTGKNAIEEAIRLEGQIRILFKQAEQEHIARLQSNKCNIERGIVYVEVLSLLESIVRHLGNIATRTSTITSDQS